MIDLSNIPNEPGCYLFKSSSGIIIYIGKAKNLKKRVSSYFNKTHNDGKTKLLVSQIKDVSFFVTNSEVESLILENNLIKKHLPRYNINLKDSKRYAYLRLTSEEYPRLLLARHTRNKGTYFGPYVSAQTRDYILYTLRKSFKLRTCNRMPKKACLRYHINLCSAPCENKISKLEYLETCANAKMVLKGHTKELSLKLNAEMEKQSSLKNYETALELRNQLAAIKWVDEKQTMERQKDYDEDVINYTVKDDHVYLILFNVRRGILENKQEFDFEYSLNFFEEFVLQYYSDNNIPKELILPKNISGALKEYLEMKREKKVVVTVPKIGDKKHLLDLVTKNIELSFFGDIGKLEDLKKNLRLNVLPTVIECFDISHLGGTSTVASMVQFRNGRPDKSNYRRFKIKTVDGIDDFKSMAEVVRRRYTRLIKEESSFPDLIIIDGGKGQLRYAMQELKELNIKIPMISVAKKFEEVFVPGLRVPIILKAKSKALLLIQAIRDESHRFAITYNRLLRKKKIREQSL